MCANIITKYLLNIYIYTYVSFGRSEGACAEEKKILTTRKKNKINKRRFVFGFFFRF